jgi:hypothetical protein
MVGFFFVISEAFVFVVVLCFALDFFGFFDFTNFEAELFAIGDDFELLVADRRVITFAFERRVSRAVEAKPETAVNPRLEPPRPDRVTTIAARKTKDLLLNCGTNNFIRTLWFSVNLRPNSVGYDETVATAKIVLEENVNE